MYLVHNGVVRLSKDDQEKYVKDRVGEVDTELMLHVIRHFKEQGLTTLEAISSMGEHIHGSHACVLYDKETPNDFALWKMATSEELERGIYYEAPWGRGRPGWHIECSVMSRKYLGDTLDIHSGGEDLIFPHHENEIAQSEGLTGKKFVRFWVHNGFLKINGRKMSKSLGNYISFDEVLSKYSPDTFRYFYLSIHYRKPIDYTEKAIKSAENSAQRLMNTLDLIGESLRAADQKLDYTVNEEAFLSEIQEHRRNFEEAMDDDLDTHGALDALHAFSKALNEYVAGGWVLDVDGGPVIPTVWTFPLIRSVFTDKELQRSKRPELSSPRWVSVG